MLPKSSKIIRTEAIDKDKFVIIMKSKCRHYSLVEVTVDLTQEGELGLFITDVKNRCGLKKCAEKIF